jgi:hypothetical protein
MKTNENQEIGELLAGIIANGFSVNIFQRWKIQTVETGKESGQESETENHSGESLTLSPTPPPKTYIAIQSNELRMTPELNQRCLKGDSLIESMRKAAKVAQYIVDTSTPIE